MAHLGILRIKLSIALVILFSFFGVTLEVKAAPPHSSYGWLASKVEYVGDAPSSCPADKAALDIVLVDFNTKTPLTNPIGEWKVETKASNGALVDLRIYSGVKQSDPICFDPVSDGIKIKVDSSSFYEEFEGPTIYPSDTDTESLNQMRGGHFRGYLELVTKGSLNPNIQLVSPSGFFSSNIVLSANIDALTSQHNAGLVKNVKFYLINTNNNTLSKFSIDNINLSGGVFTIDIPSASLAEGAYSWTVHADLDGEATTNKYTSPARTWSFLSIPSSGTTELKSFTLDRTPPAASFSQFPAISSINSSNDNLVNIEFTKRFTDNIALQSASVRVIDSNGISVKEYPFSYNLAKDRTEVITVPNLERGKTYKIQSTVIDAAGNRTDTTIHEFSIPMIFTVPTVTIDSPPTTVAPTHISLSLYGDVTDRADNFLLVTRLGVCWSVNQSDLQDENTFMSLANCSDDVPGFSNTSNPADGSFQKIINSFPLNTTIYYRMMAQNAEGWGFSPIDNTTTPASPFDDPSLQGSPSIGFVHPSIINTDALDPGIRIDSTGGTKLDYYGICYGIDQTFLNNINHLDPTEVTSNHNCKLWNWGESGAMNVLSSLPFTQRHTFSNLNQNTLHYFKVFAVNTYGSDLKTGNAKTREFYHMFRNSVSNATPGFPGVSRSTFDSPEFMLSNSTFNSTAGKYDTVSFIISVVDQSTKLLSPVPPNLNPSQDNWPRRDVNYKVTLTTYENGDRNTGSIVETREKSGIIPAMRLGAQSPGQDSGSAYQVLGNYHIVTFDNVPLGDIDIRSTVDSSVNPSYIPFKDLLGLSSRLVEMTLVAPSNPSDLLNTVDNSSGGTLLLDPEVELKATPNIIRAGESTTLAWKMNNVNGDLNCNITGPSTFGTSGTHTFNHSFSSTAGDHITDSISSGPLYNTQIFRFTCVNPITAGSYSITTRVTVIGKPEEI